MEHLFRMKLKMKRNKKKTMTLKVSSLLVSIVPQNVCQGGVACTLNTRYEDAAIRDYITLAHFPKTAWCYIYETV